MRVPGDDEVVHSPSICCEAEAARGSDISTSVVEVACATVHEGKFR